MIMSGVVHLHFHEQCMQRRLDGSGIIPIYVLSFYFQVEVGNIFLRTNESSSQNIINACLAHPTAAACPLSTSTEIEILFFPISILTQNCPSRNFPFSFPLRTVHLDVFPISTALSPSRLEPPRISSPHEPHTIDRSGARLQLLPLIVVQPLIKIKRNYEAFLYAQLRSLPFRSWRCSIRSWLGPSHLDRRPSR